MKTWEPVKGAMVSVVMEDGTDFDGEVVELMDTDTMPWIGIKTMEFSKTAGGKQQEAVIWLPERAVRMVVVTAPAGE